MRIAHVLGGAILALGLASTAAQATQVITFDNLVSGDIASTQFAGVVFTGASVLTENTSLNSLYFPVSDPNVVYNISSDSITLNFTVSGVTSVGAFVTDNTSVTENLYSGLTLLGSVSTGGSNYSGAGTGIPINLFLNLSGTDITSAVFTGANGLSNSFTLDNVTVNGADVIGVGTVPLPASAPMFGAALLALGAVGFGMKRKAA